jgi:hypothetical protein
MNRVGAIVPLVSALLAGGGCGGAPGGAPDGSVPDGGAAEDGGPVLLTGAAAEVAASCQDTPGLWIAGPASGGAAGTASDWSVGFGDSSNDEAEALAAGPDGGPVVLSFQYGVVDFGTAAYAVPPSCYMVLSAFSPSGALRWSRAVTGWSASVAVGPDGGPFLLMSDYSIASLAPDGHARWVWANPLPIGFQLGVSDDAVFAVLEGAYDNGFYDMIIQRLSLDGAPVGSFTIPANTWPAFDVSSNDEVVFATAFTGTLVLGGTSFQSTGNEDFVVGKLGADGKLRWARQFGTTGDDGAPAVSFSSDGSVVLYGFGNQALDFGSGPIGATDVYGMYLARLDPEGNPVAGRALSNVWFGGSLGQTPSGQVVIAGNFNGPVTIDGTTVHTGAVGDVDFLVVETSPSFEVQKIQHFGNGGGNQSLAGLVVDGQGGWLLAGQFEGKLDLGSGIMRSAGGRDTFVGRVQP